MKKEDKKMDEKKDVIACWKNLLLFFYEKEEISTTCLNKITALLENEEFSSLLTEIEPEINEEEKKNAIQGNLEILKKLYERRNEPSKAGEDYERLKKCLMVNEEKYVDDAYERTRLYLILYHMFKGTYGKLYSYTENKIYEKKYEKYNPMGGEYHCPSPTLDLIIQNVHKGGLYKRKPQNLDNKAEYSYDENGRLIMYRWFINSERWYFTEFLLYGEKEIVHIRFGEKKETNPIQEISIQTYSGEQIASYEAVSYISPEEPSEIYKEVYEYKKGLLKNLWIDQFIFPNILLSRKNYIFESDREGFLRGYIYKEFWGDGERVSPWGDTFVKIQEKKRLDTGKNARRWRRPNCCEEQENS